MAKFALLLTALCSAWIFVVAGEAKPPAEPAVAMKDQARLHGIYMAESSSEIWLLRVEDEKLRLYRLTDNDGIVLMGAEEVTRSESALRWGDKEYAFDERRMVLPDGVQMKNTLHRDATDDEREMAMFFKRKLEQSAAHRHLLTRYLTREALDKSRENAPKTPEDIASRLLRFSYRLPSFAGSDMCFGKGKKGLETKITEYGSGVPVIREDVYSVKVIPTDDGDLWKLELRFERTEEGGQPSPGPDPAFLLHGPSMELRSLRGRHLSYPSMEMRTEDYFRKHRIIE